MSESPSHERAFIEISGPGRAPFLQGLVTQDVGQISEGGAKYAALLTPQGKLLHAFFVIARRDALWIDAPAHEADALFKRFQLYKLRAEVELSQRHDLAVATSADHAIDQALICFEDPRAPGLGKRAVLARGDAAAADGDYLARRLLVGVPEPGVDFPAGAHFPMDVNLDLLDAISYHKGCFIGQEVASRMKRKGAVRKRTLKVAGKILHGPIESDGSTIGEVIAARADAGLALVRLDRLQKARENGAPCFCGGAAVEVTPPAYLNGEREGGGS